MNLTEAQLADPHDLYEQLREQAPVTQVTMPPGIRAWLITRYDDVRAALADPRLARDHVAIVKVLERHSDPELVYALKSSLSAHMVHTDPPAHTRLRRLVSRAFTPRTIAPLRPRVEQIAGELLDRVEAQAAGTGGEVDLLDSFAFPLPITVITELLGVSIDRREEFRRWSSTLMSHAPAPQLQAASQALNAFLRDLVDDKRHRPGPDMLSIIVAPADDADRLGDDEAVAMAFLLLAAGHQTTVNLICSGMLALLQHPDQLAALRADPSLIPAAVEEFLRYDGPINLAPMYYTAEAVTIGGVTIPAGELIVLGLASANRDQEAFAHADRLDITRTPNPHLGFGHGIHYCLGAPLARLEGEVAFAALLDRFPDLALAREPGRIPWHAGPVLRGLTELPVRLFG